MPPRGVYSLTLIACATVLDVRLAMRAKPESFIMTMIENFELRAIILGVRDDRALAWHHSRPDYCPLNNFPRKFYPML
jgi:hypothetical protein